MSHAQLSRDTAAQPRSTRAGAPASRHAMVRLLSELQYALDEHFFDYRRGGRDLAMRRVKLGVELLCKLEEQLLLPALRASRDAEWPELDKALEEVGMLRDLTRLLHQPLAARQSTLVPAIEGLAQLHFAALDELLAHADDATVSWARLEREMREQLAAWRVEIGEHGALEDDEDEDPVGEPPR